MRFDKSLFREAFLTIDIRTLGLARIYIALFRAYEITQRPPPPGQEGPRDVQSHLVMAKRR